MSLLENEICSKQSGVCEVCGCPLSFASASDSLCNSIDCKKIADQKQVLSPPLYESFLKFERERLFAKRAEEAAKLEHIKAVEDTEAGQNQHLLDEFVQRSPEYENRALLTFSLPSGPSRLVPLVADRIDRFFQHLQETLFKARECKDSSEVVFDQHHNARNILLENEKQFAANPQLQTVSDRLCGLCKGGCCPEGADHAFVSVITLRRRLDENPQLSDEDIIQAYQNYLTTEVLEGGCLFQTADGCALPRHLRSDICNSYFCEPLRSYQRQAESDDIVGVLAVQRANNQWNRFDTDSANPIEGVYLVEEECVRIIDVVPEFE